MRSVVVVAILATAIGSACSGGYSQDELDAAVNAAAQAAVESASTTEPNALETETEVPTTDATTTTTVTTTSSTVATRDVEGTVNASWLVDPPNANRSEKTCTDMARSYQIEIRDGGDFVQSLARLEQPRLLSNEIDEVSQWIECSYTYGATVPVLPVYTITVSDSDERLAAVTLTDDELGDEGGAEFFVSFQCIVYPCEARGSGHLPSEGAVTDTNGGASTTTVFEAVDTGAIDLSASSASCNDVGGGAVEVAVMFEIRNSGSSPVELFQVAVFPYGSFGHSFLEPEGWWPLPSLQPGESASHVEAFDLGTEWSEDQIELFVDSAAGSASMFLPCRL